MQGLYEKCFFEQEFKNESRRRSHIKSNGTPLWLGRSNPQEWHLLKNCKSVDYGPFSFILILALIPLSPHPLNLSLGELCLLASLLDPACSLSSADANLATALIILLSVALSELSYRGKQRQLSCVHLVPFQSTISVLRTIFLQSWTC